MSAGPGWYPDPGGQPYLYRFWNGTTWSAETTANPSSPPPGTLPPPPPKAPTGSPPSQRRSSLGWFLGAGALLVVIALVAVFILRSVGGVELTDAPSQPPGSVDTCPEAATPTAAPPAQTGDRVSSGKLSYPRLPYPFDAPSWDARVPFGRDVQNQDVVVEAGTSGTPTWVSSVLIARLLAGDGFFGPEQGARVVANCVVGKFYGNVPVQRDDRRDEAVTVDGHQAWVIESHLTFEVPGIQTKGETMILVVVDTSDGEAGLFYASIPDTSPQFLEPSRRALADLKVAD